MTLFVAEREIFYHSFGYFFEYNSFYLHGVVFTFLHDVFSHPVSGSTKFQLCILKNMKIVAMQSNARNTLVQDLYTYRDSLELFLDYLTDLLVNRPTFDIFLFSYIQNSR